jgi:hypothetical protein
MRVLMLLAVAGCAWSQAFTDAAGVIAGSSVGVGAGKKLSDGVTSVLQKVDATSAKAAKIDVTAKPTAKASEKVPLLAGPVIQTAPGGVVKDHSLVPPPPAKKVAVIPPPPPPVAMAAPAVLAPVYAPPPPPPPAKVEDLRTLASGTTREEVLKLGVPSSCITMFDDGHLVEIYRYQNRETTLGVVRLSDGSVSSVQVP